MVPQTALEPTASLLRIISTIYCDNTPEDGAPWRYNAGSECGTAGGPAPDGSGYTPGGALVTHSEGEGSFAEGGSAVQQIPSEIVGAFRTERRQQRSGGRAREGGGASAEVEASLVGAVELGVEGSSQDQVEDWFEGGAAVNQQQQRSEGGGSKRQHEGSEGVQFEGWQPGSQDGRAAGPLEGTGDSSRLFITSVDEVPLGLPAACPTSDLQAAATGAQPRAAQAIETAAAVGDAAGMKAPAEREAIRDVGSSGSSAGGRDDDSGLMADRARAALLSLAARLESRVQLESELSGFVSGLGERRGGDGERLVEVPADFLMAVQRMIAERRGEFRALDGWGGLHR